MLKPIRFGLHIYFIWPPVLVLSILNAFTEEVVFRLVLFRLLMKATNNAVVSNFIQALAYAAIHVFIGGPVFAAQAFALGVLLGFIMDSLSGAPFGVYMSSYLWFFLGVRWISRFLHSVNSILLPFVMASGVLVENVIYRILLKIKQKVILFN